MNRYIIVLVISCFIVLGSLTTMGATTTARDEALRGVVDATQTSDLPFRVPRLGVNADLTQYSDVVLPNELSLMRSAHIVWIRQFFRWDDIEQSPNRYIWDKYDRIVSAVSAAEGLEWVAVIYGAPSWLRDLRANDSASAPPISTAAFETFLRAFAERYGNAITYYEIWDEPNLSASWGGLPPHPADYLSLLAAGYRAIHSADPHAVVMTAALAPTEEQGPQNISDWRYLNDLYALGGKNSFDAVAAKPYGFDDPPHQRTVREERLNFSRVVALREIMVAHGDGNKALWASQWGWNALPSNWRGAPSIWGSVTQDQQVDYTLSALARAEREWPWMGGMILQQWQPALPCDSPQWGFALRGCDQSNSALLNALLESNWETLPLNGIFPPASPYAQYSGVWTFGELGADIGWVQDSAARFRFHGTDAGLLLREGNYSAFLYVTVDNQPANQLPRDNAGQSYLNLHSVTGALDKIVVPIARGLSLDDHTLSFIADRGWDQWALVGYAISSGNLSLPYDNQIMVASLTLVVSTLSSIVALSQIPLTRLIRPINHFIASLGGIAQLSLTAFASIGVMFGMLLTWNDGIPNIFRRDAVQLLLAFLSAGIIYLQPHIIVLFIAILLLALMVYQKPQYGLFLTLFYAPFFLFPVELYQFSIPMAELLILLTTAVSLLRAFVLWSIHWKKHGQFLAIRPLIQSLNGIDIALFFWFFIALISLSWADIRDSATTEFRTLFFEPLCFYVILRMVARDRQTILRSIGVLLTAGLVVSLVGLFLYFTGAGIITAEGGVQRLASVYGSPNNVALFLGRCFPFALAITLLSKNNLRRTVAAVCTVVMLIALFLTQSAGALFLSVPASFIVVVMLIYGRRALPILTITGVAGTLLSTFLLRSARFQRLLDFSQGTNFFRLRVWESALSAIADHPITGLGLDQFLYAYQGYYLRPDAWQEPNLSHPHNFLLDIWLRLGIMGIGVFLWLQITFWHFALHNVRVLRHIDPQLTSISIGIIGCMVSLLIHGLVDNSVFVLDLSYIFVFVLGIVSNIKETASRSVS